MLLCVAFVVSNELLLDPLVRTHALPVIKPGRKFSTPALGCHLLHSRATMSLVCSDVMPLLETLETLRLANLSSQHAEFQSEYGERSPLEKTVSSSTKEIATPESVDLLLKLFHVANACLKCIDISAKEVGSSKGISSQTLMFPELSDIEPLHDASPELLLMA
ncbi:hypothetical protein F441_05627 [Phytophthora nicotianae CJ01A1]|uniref:Uncharacterized protein n=2 Tax=Phytophthora nicotianae TaxID=4792 RepID=W2ZNV0_PHYNI|nr:hypothetical protein F441_05627 [Phytophthora nicotianae CJ01A1]ETP48646.1 hypothetical protein F442_05659 [Phytophthora nicotianae P10297]